MLKQNTAEDYTAVSGQTSHWHKTDPNFGRHCTLSLNITAFIHCSRVWRRPNSKLQSVWHEQKYWPDDFLRRAAAAAVHLDLLHREGYILCCLRSFPAQFCSHFFLIWLHPNPSSNRCEWAVLIAESQYVSLWSLYIRTEKCKLYYSSLEHRLMKIKYFIYLMF